MTHPTFRGRWQFAPLQPLPDLIGAPGHDDLRGDQAVSLFEWANFVGDGREYGGDVERVIGIRRVIEVQRDRVQPRGDLSGDRIDLRL